MRQLVSQILISSPQDMINLGYGSGRIIRGHDVVFLEGPLGSGKTTFAKGFGRALGVTEEILSPTFVLVHEFIGDLPLYHFDLYRLESVAELNQIGFFDLIGRNGIKLIEWSDQFPSLEEQADWVFKFSHQGTDKRSVEVYECSP